MAKTKNAIIEKYENGRAAAVDEMGVVRDIPDGGYELGQIVYLDTEAIDIAEAIKSEEAVNRAIDGDFDPVILSFSGRVKKTVARRAFPIAASFALAMIFGVGGSVYANGEVAQSVESDGVTYDMNYFNRVIGVHIEDVDDRELLELKRDMRGKKFHEAKEMADDRKKEFKPRDNKTKEEFINEDDIDEKVPSEITEDEAPKESAGEVVPEEEDTFGIEDIEDDKGLVPDNNMHDEDSDSNIENHPTEERQLREQSGFREDKLDNREEEKTGKKQEREKNREEKNQDVQMEKPDNDKEDHTEAGSIHEDKVKEVPQDGIEDEPQNEMGSNTSDRKRGEADNNPDNVFSEGRENNPGGGMENSPGGGSGDGPGGGSGNGPGGPGQ